jgi:hypothetical protein
MNANDPKNILGVELSEGEVITEETVEELSNGKGNDENE